MSHPPQVKLRKSRIRKNEIWRSKSSAKNCRTLAGNITWSLCILTSKTTIRVSSYDQYQMVIISYLGHIYTWRNWFVEVPHHVSLANQFGKVSDSISATTCIWIAATLYIARKFLWKIRYFKYQIRKKICVKFSFFISLHGGKNWNMRLTLESVGFSVRQLTKFVHLYVTG